MDRLALRVPRWVVARRGGIPEGIARNRPGGCRLLVSARIVWLARPCASLARPCASLARPCASLARPCASLARPCASLARPCASLARPCATVARGWASLARSCARLTRPCGSLSRSREERVGTWSSVADHLAGADEPHSFPSGISSLSKLRGRSGSSSATESSIEDAPSRNTSRSTVRASASTRARRAEHTTAAWSRGRTAGWRARRARWSVFHSHCTRSAPKVRTVDSIGAPCSLQGLWTSFPRPAR